MSECISLDDSNRDENRLSCLVSFVRYWPAAALIAAAALLWPVFGLTVDGEDRCRLFLLLDEGERIDLTWRHSVDGILVRDVFTRRGAILYLSASYNPYFAAGLGEVPGRGRVVGTEDHGLAIIDINEPVERLPLRVGSTEVHHTLHHRGHLHDLSAKCPQRSVVLTVVRRPLIFWAQSMGLARLFGGLGQDPRFLLSSRNSEPPRLHPLPDGSR